MNKEERIRKIIILIGSVMVIIGGFLMLTRGNPLDKVIGRVIITNGVDRMEVEGYKYSYNNKNNSDKLENFIPITEADNIPEIDYHSKSDNNIAVSYSEDYAGDLSYTVYDSDFNVLIDAQPNLTMPGENGKKYYVEIGVNWGEEKKNVTVKYYFSINITD